IMSAVYDRNRDDGKGQIIDLSLYESMMRLVDPLIIGYDQMGIIKKRGGNRMEEDAPRNTYLTKDEHWLAISASSNQTFKRLVQAIKRPELAEDTRFRNNPDRVKNVEELDKIIGDWIASKSLKEIEEIFKYYDVVAGPVYDIEDIFKDIQIKA